MLVEIRNGGAKVSLNSTLFNKFMFKIIKSSSLFEAAKFQGFRVSEKN